MMWMSVRLDGREGTASRGVTIAWTLLMKIDRMGTKGSGCMMRMSVRLNRREESASRFLTFAWIQLMKVDRMGAKGLIGK